MDIIKKYKRQLILLLIPLIILGIVLLYTIYSVNKINPLDQHLLSVLLVALWLMMYIHYANLKTKIEILKGLEKEKAITNE